MATTTLATLALTFVDKDGNDVVFSYPHANTSCYESDIKALVQGLITNGSIFANPPVIVKSAKLLVSEVTSIDL